MTGLACRLKVGGVEGEIRARVQAENMVYLGTEGALAELADGVEGEIESAGMAPRGRVVEWFVEVMRRGGGRGVRSPDPLRGLMEGAATSGDEGGAAGEGAGAERHHTGR